MNTPLKKSIALHIVAFLICVIDLPLFWSNRPTEGQVPIIIDLKDVKISEMTNLPPKAELGKEDKAASTVKRKIEKQYTQDEAKSEPQPKAEKAPEKKVEVKEEAPQPPKKDFLVAPQPKKPVKKVEKTPAKPEPKPVKKQENNKKPEPKKDTKKPELANPLKSLLASVDDLEKSLGETNEKAVIKEGTKVNNMGVEGGTSGSYFSELSISELDALAGRLRGCWNLDPGARGIEDMVVEIRAYLNQNGTVARVDILDTARYNSDTHFRSVADSARRAVHICGPYTLLSEKYAEKYDMWKSILLRFNPMDASIK